MIHPQYFWCAKKALSEKYQQFWIRKDSEELDSEFEVFQVSQGIYLAYVFLFT